MMTRTKRTRRKSLNVYNSDRYYNLRLHEEHETGDEVIRDRGTLDTYIANSDTVEIHDDYMPDVLLLRGDEELTISSVIKDPDIMETIVQRIGSVHYQIEKSTLEDTEVLRTVGRLGEHRDNEVSVPYQQTYTSTEAHHVRMYSRITTTNMNVTIDIEEDKATDICMGLFNLRFAIDDLHIHFLAKKEVPKESKYLYEYCRRTGKYHVKAIEQFKYFKEIHDPLSIWKMSINLYMHSREAREQILKYVLEEYESFEKR